MAIYHYSACNAQGSKIIGKREASSAEDLAMALKNESLIPLDIFIDSSKEPGFKQNRKKFLEFFAAKLPPEELQIFCRQMHTLTKAGIPINLSIMRLMETSRSAILIKTLKTVLLHLNHGKQFSESMAQCPEIFSDFFIKLLKIGESSGSLDLIFLYLADYHELKLNTQKKIKKAAQYPKMVLFSILIATIIINIYVIPSFVKLYHSVHTDLPIPTQILMASSHFIIHQGFWLLTGSIVLTLIFYYWKNTPQGLLIWAKIYLDLPILGPIHKKIILTQFSKILAMALRTGIPPVEAIGLVGTTTNNAYFAEKIKALSELIARGNSISEAMNKNQLFSPLMIQMIALGEESGHIDALLEELAQFYQRELDYDIAHLTEMIEPILLLGVGVLVLILALGVFLPMWKIASAYK